MRYPLVKQNGYRSCGPCSLASIIRYYKGYLSVDYLEEAMKTDRMGTSAYNLIMASKKIGFDAYGMKVDNLNNLKPPLIAHVTMNGIYDHFVVIYKVLDNKILVADPAAKLKYMATNEFLSIWNNMVIVLNPIKKMPVNKPKCLFKFLKEELKENLSRIIYLIFISNIFSIVSLIYTLYIKNVVDNMEYTLISFLSIFVLNYFLLIYKNILLINLNKNISYSLTKKINNSLIKLPYIYYKNHKIGEIISRYSDINSLNIFVNDMIQFITTIPIIILFLVFMYIESKILFMYNLFVIIVYILYGAISSFILKNDIKNIKAREAYTNSYLYEALNSFETVKGLNIENNIIDKLNNNEMDLKSTLCKVYKKYNIRDVVLDVIHNIGLLFIIFIGFSLYHKNYIELTSLITFYILYTNLSQPLLSIPGIFLSYKESSIKVRRIQELFYPFTSQMIEDGAIEYKNTIYKIGSKKVLDISLKIDKGEKVLIYGANGSGKSTLVKMLKGYIKSNVLISNKKIFSKVDNIVYVSKGDKLFEDTLLNNLMSNDLLMINELMSLFNLNKKLNTYIEEDGFNLSSGEKSKIILMRALLKDFDILIIDEALSEIDIKSERKILNYIFNKYKDKTIIVIMHRFDNKDLFDHYIKLDNGKITKNIKKGE